MAHHTTGSQYNRRVSRAIRRNAADRSQADAIPLRYIAARDTITPTDMPPRPAKGRRKETIMAQISINNGHSYMTAAEAMPEIAANNLWDAVVNVMDDDIREAVHNELVPCTDLEFLAAYLERAADDLIIA
jgi:hypothetical protein